MSRRTAERHARRVEIRFWRRGSDSPHSGFTVDLSKTGLFLGTSLALEPGERLRLEIVDRERGFSVEGQVARVHRVTLALRHVEQPGVGVRFLSPAELVGDLLQPTKQRAGSDAPAAAGTAPERAREEASSPAGARRDGAAARASAADDLFGDETQVPPPAAARVDRPAPPPSRSAQVVPVEFVDRATFLAVYERDIAAGGLFVNCEEPADLHTVVLVELRPPVPAAEALAFEARVVHRFDGRQETGRTGRPGMGLQFLDPDRVRAALAPVLRELRG